MTVSVCCLSSVVPSPFPIGRNPHITRCFSRGDTHLFWELNLVLTPHRGQHAKQGGKVSRVWLCLHFCEHQWQHSFTLLRELVSQENARMAPNSVAENDYLFRRRKLREGRVPAGRRQLPNEGGFRRGPLASEQAYGRHHRPPSRVDSHCQSSPANGSLICKSLDTFRSCDAMNIADVPTITGSLRRDAVGGLKSPCYRFRDVLATTSNRPMTPGRDANHSKTLMGSSASVRPCSTN